MPAELHLATVDYVIVVLVLLSAGFGVMCGFVREVLSLVIWGTALLLGFAFADLVGKLIASSLDDRLRVAAGFAFVFIVVLIVGAVAQRFIGGLVTATGLSGTDRMIGLLFGALRGLVLAVAALIVLAPLVGDQAWWEESMLIPHFERYEKDVKNLGNVIADLFRNSPADAESTPVMELL